MCKSFYYRSNWEDTAPFWCVLIVMYIDVYSKKTSFGSLYIIWKWHKILRAKVKLVMIPLKENFIYAPYFMPLIAFYGSRKHDKTRDCDVFIGYKRRAVVWNGLTRYIYFFIYLNFILRWHLKNRVLYNSLYTNANTNGINIQIFMLIYVNQTGGKWTA